MDRNTVHEENEPSYLVNKYRALRRRLPVDLMCVDEDVSEMPVLIQEVGEAVALVNERRDAAKQLQDVTYAEVSSELRAVKDGNGKAPSEAQITNMMPAQPRYIEAVRNYAQAKLDADLWFSLSEAMRQKSYSLNVAAQMITAGFITPDSIQQNRRREQRAQYTQKES